MQAHAHDRSLEGDAEDIAVRLDIQAELIHKETYELLDIVIRVQQGPLHAVYSIINVIQHTQELPRRLVDNGDGHITHQVIDGTVWIRHEEGELVECLHHVIPGPEHCGHDIVQPQVFHDPEEARQVPVCQGDIVTVRFGSGQLLHLEEDLRTVGHWDVPDPRIHRDAAKHRIRRSRDLCVDHCIEGCRRHIIQGQYPVIRCGITPVLIQNSCPGQCDLHKAFHSRDIGQCHTYEAQPGRHVKIKYLVGHLCSEGKVPDSPGDIPLRGPTCLPIHIDEKIE